MQKIERARILSLDMDKWGKLACYDDFSGDSLDPALVEAARELEVEYLKKMKVYDVVNRDEITKSGKGKLIKGRWLDVNKGDSSNPNYRSRLVAKEFNTGVCPELYAATPPSECLRIMISKAANGCKKGVSMMYADVSRAYFYAKAVRPVYVKLPYEYAVEGHDEGKCGTLQLSMHGARDAALN